jgi:hypothetical protein
MEDTTGAAGNTEGDRQGQPEDDAEELMFSSLTTHWVEARDTIESFANKYLAPANRDNTITTSELMQDTLLFGRRMSELWLTGLGIVVEESGRLARRAAERSAGQDGSETAGS